MDSEFEEIVDRHYEDIFRFAYSLTRSRSEACDLTQHAFWRYAEKRRSLRKAASVKAWLLRTAKNKFLDEARRNRRFPHTPLEKCQDPPAAEPTDPGVGIDAGSALEALQSLEEKYRGPVALYYLEGLHYREIAEVLGIPIGTVMSRLSRGKHQLKSLLENPQED